MEELISIEEYKQKRKVTKAKLDKINQKFWDKSKKRLYKHYENIKLSLIKSINKGKIWCNITHKQWEQSLSDYRPFRKEGCWWDEVVESLEKEPIFDGFLFKIEQGTVYIYLKEGKK